jgi:hypothetical protein
MEKRKGSGLRLERCVDWWKKRDVQPVNVLIGLLMSAYSAAGELIGSVIFAMADL